MHLVSTMCAEWFNMNAEKKNRLKIYTSKFHTAITRLGEICLWRNFFKMKFHSSKFPRTKFSTAKFLVTKFYSSAKLDPPIYLMAYHSRAKSYFEFNCGNI